MASPCSLRPTTPLPVLIAGAEVRWRAGMEIRVYRQWTAPMNDILAGLIIACLLFVLSYLVAMALGAAVEAQFRQREDAERLDERLRAALSLYRRLEDRCRQIMPQVARLDGSVRSMQRRTYMASKKVGDLAAKREQLIRELTEEGAFTRSNRPARHYIGEVINRHVQRALLDHKVVSGLSTSWGRVQSVHVWATSLGAAKSLLDTYYPRSTGFHILEIREPSVDEPVEILESLDDDGEAVADLPALAG